MALSHYYRILGLRTGAGFDDVKLAYRNLARLYHPDVNPGDQLAKEKFIQVTQAYQSLVDALPAAAVAATRRTASVKPVASDRPSQAAPPAAKPASPPVAQSEPAPSAAVEFTISPTPGGSETDQKLKIDSYKQLREFFGGQRFPRAVALVEGLVQRFPEDPEIRQWHAITYYRWGHDLLINGNLAKAEVCLKKARRVDPQNKSLRQALLQDFQRLEYLRQAPMPQAQ